MCTDTKHIHVVAAIIIQNGQVFATQRGYGEWKGWWEFPGGKIEPNESHRHALQREIQEELDTLINVEKLFATVQYDYPTFHLTLYCYLCSVVSGNLTLLEHQDAKWLSKEQLPTVQWLPADLQIIRQLIQII